MVNHECEKCGYGIRNDVCFCESCKEEEVQNAYDEGKKEGYEDARKEFENK